MTRGPIVVVLALGLGAVGSAVWWWTSPPPPVPGATPTASAAPTPSAPTSPIRFEDVIDRVGVPFRHADGATPTQFLPEVMGGGVAWLDFDRDGFLDLFLVQGGAFPPDPDAKSANPTSRLYRNRGDGRFDDVTAAVGLLTPGYGQGVAVGDYDRDGFPDLFVSHYGGGTLHHNEPNGAGGRRFRDVSNEAGIELDGWCSSCAFGDLHGTGHPDLFVGRYLALDPANYPVCTEKGKQGPVRTACGPRHFAGTRSVLFRNNGDGTFTDVSAAAKIEDGGKALGVVILDLDGDGRNELFVGNDEVPNHHYKNLGGGRVQSIGVASGTSSTFRGRPMGSMGIEAGDLFGDGRPDLFVTTYVREGTVLFRNRGGNFFTDVSQSAGMFAASWDKVGWGTGLIDADRDGNLDLFVANGHTHRNAADLAPAETGRDQTFAQLAQVFAGNGKGRFAEVSESAGPYFRTPRVGRGVAQADFDNDGRSDLAVNHIADAPALLRNVTETKTHWIRVELEGARHRDTVGAVVTVRAGGRTFVRHRIGGGSYYSAQESRLLIGLGVVETIDSIEVRWPNAAGTVQTFAGVPVDAGYRFVEGASAALPVTSPLIRIPASAKMQP